LIPLSFWLFLLHCCLKDGVSKTNIYFIAAGPVMGGALGNPLMLTAGPTGGMLPQQSPMMTGAPAPYGMGGSPSGMYGGGL
jgi:hypothetical protein